MLLLQEDRAGEQVSVLAEEVRRLTGRLESCQEELSQLRPEVHRLREREENHRHQLMVCFFLCFSVSSAPPLLISPCMFPPTPL